MENKVGVGFIVFATVAVLVGLAFWTPVGANISTLTQTQTQTNVSTTLPAIGVVSDFGVCGQRNTTAVVIFNQTNGTGVTGVPLPELPAANFTISQGTSPTDGYLITRINITTGTVGFAGHLVNVTCTYEPRGYISDGAGRNVAVLIPIFLALAIAFAAFPDLREWVKGIGGGK